LDKSYKFTQKATKEGRKPTKKSAVALTIELAVPKKTSKGMYVNYKGPRKVARKHVIRIYRPIT
jgi:hypothetical protein